jgi:P-type conjugative transfer protein TrbJ
VILAATASPTPARAQFFGPMPVVDAGAIGKLVTQLGVARDQLATLRRNMEKLGRYDLRDVRATMAQVDLVARQGEAISYSLADLERVVAETFPGAVHGGPSQADLRRQDARTLATIRGALAASRVTAQQFAAEVAALDAVKAQLRGIRTAQQAAELSGVVAVHSAEELTLLRQQLAAQANAQTVYLAYQANRATQAAAAAAAFDSAGARRPPPRARRDVYALGFEP